MSIPSIPRTPSTPSISSVPSWFEEFEGKDSEEGIEGIDVVRIRPVPLLRSSPSPVEESKELMEYALLQLVQCLLS